MNASRDRRRPRSKTAMLEAQIIKLQFQNKELYDMLMNLSEHCCCYGREHAPSCVMLLVRPILEKYSNDD